MCCGASLTKQDININVMEGCLNRVKGIGCVNQDSCLHSIITKRFLMACIVASYPATRPAQSCRRPTTSAISSPLQNSTMAFSRILQGKSTLIQQYQSRVFIQWNQSTSYKRNKNCRIILRSSKAVSNRCQNIIQNNQSIAKGET